MGHGDDRAELNELAVPIGENAPANFGVGGDDGYLDGVELQLTPYFANRSGANFSPSPAPLGTAIWPLTGIGGVS